MGRGGVEGHVKFETAVCWAMLVFDHDARWAPYFRPNCKSCRIGSSLNSSSYLMWSMVCVCKCVCVCVLVR